MFLANCLILCLSILRINKFTISAFSSCSNNANLSSSEKTAGVSSLKNKNLLLGYNDYQEGELLVDGVDIKVYNKASYRKNLGIVLQNPALFAGTIKSNVTMEREYSDEEVIKVIEEVGAGYMLDKNELGIHTPVSSVLRPCPKKQTAHLFLLLK